MIWVLCEPEDEDALWLAAALKRRNEAVELMLPEELMVGSALTLRIDSARVTSSLRLHEGRLISANSPGLVINRLVSLPAFSGVREATDGAYLAEEWRATITAWLRTFQCPVLNPPRAASLAGLMISPPVWRSIAQAYGMKVRPWDSHSVSLEGNQIELVCVGSKCIDATGSVPSEIAESLASMSRHVGTPLLGATFDRTEKGWEFVDATPLPHFTRMGGALVDAIVECTRKVESAL